MLRVKKEGNLYYIQKRRLGRWYKQLSYYSESVAIEVAKNMWGCKYDRPVKAW